MIWSSVAIERISGFVETRVLSAAIVHGFLVFVAWQARSIGLFVTFRGGNGTGCSLV